MSPERKITFVSIVINIVLTGAKFAAGIFGRSQALIADAIHSLSDFATDIAVLVGLRFTAKPSDEDHAYGHGKYETLAAAIIGVVLAYVALRIAGSAIQRIFGAIHGVPIPRPSTFAFWTAFLSFFIKEWLYQATMKVACDSSCRWWPTPGITARTPFQRWPHLSAWARRLISATTGSF